MSKIITFLAASALVSQALAQAPAHEIYKKGVAAEKAGDIATANDLYANALKVDPNNAEARYSLGQLRINSASIAAKTREAKFGAVVIPIIQLENATIQEALEAFSLTIEKHSKDAAAPNFVIEDPKNLLAGRKITLTLKNMPAQAVMKYLLEQTGAKARYDEHAVVISAR